MPETTPNNPTTETKPETEQPDVTMSEPGKGANVVLDTHIPIRDAVKSAENSDDAIN